MRHSLLNNGRKNVAHLFRFRRSRTTARGQGLWANLRQLPKFLKNAAHDELQGQGVTLAGTACTTDRGETGISHVMFYYV